MEFLNTPKSNIFCKAHWHQRHEEKKHCQIVIVIAILWMHDDQFHWSSHILPLWNVFIFEMGFWFSSYFHTSHFHRVPPPLPTHTPTTPIPAFSLTPAVLSRYRAHTQKAVTTNLLSRVYEDTCWTSSDMVTVWKHSKYNQFHSVAWSLRKSYVIREQ